MSLGNDFTSGFSSGYGMVSSMQDRKAKKEQDDLLAKERERNRQDVAMRDTLDRSRQARLDFGNEMARVTDRQDRLDAQAQAQSNSDRDFAFRQGRAAEDDWRATTAAGRQAARDFSGEIDKAKGDLTDERMTGLRASLLTEQIRAAAAKNDAAAAEAALPTFGPGDEGRELIDPQGNRRIVRNGRPVLAP